ncbi:hypothetical protein GNI_003380 [Gregarina niphandrodes]|uniref:Uncharacterized protein n=1 Tax=Gregarina niphandrodes TaxID=110365 RepID=A0A023BE04_GRENI|nr:hypothetical protein GNI_003380 [Gregarina niphandrodes]EZG89045.1 hypothetical protein GNI_003380 [Gregarina niphandrodes]|eukprot:XP_011128514.1 hypothetical protein GNI_003380 [Gregarina niphandrodes]
MVQTIVGSRAPVDDEDQNQEALSFAEELETCYDYETNPGAQLGFGAFRFRASQVVGKPRPLQTPRYPNDILNYFCVHTSNTRHSKNAASPAGACQFGIFKSCTKLSDGQLESSPHHTPGHFAATGHPSADLISGPTSETLQSRVWVVCRGYGPLGGVLPDWFCLNFMKRVTTRLTEATDHLHIRNILKSTHSELADDIITILERVESHNAATNATIANLYESNPSNNNASPFDNTGIVAACGMAVNNHVVVALCGNQPHYHVTVKYTEFASDRVPYATTKEMFKNTHSYSTSKERNRIRLRLTALRELELKTKHPQFAHEKNTDISRRLIAGNKQRIVGNRPEKDLPPDTHPPDYDLADPGAWFGSKLHGSCITDYNITRGFGFTKSQTLGLSSVPDFVVIQLKSNQAKGNTLAIPDEFLLVASSPVFWQVRTPQEVASHILRLMHKENHTLQQALDRVCMCVRVESVARGFRAFNSEELAVLCIPLA